MNEDAVTQPAEQTAPIESAPIENNDASTQPEPAGAITEPERQVSDSVPYDRFREVNSRAKTLEEENAWLRSQMVQPPAEQVTPAQLEPDSEAAVRIAARKEWDEINRQNFIAKHGQELQNNQPLDALVRGLIAKNQGKLIDREALLDQAKKMLNDSMKPAVKEAQTAAFKEGQTIGVQKAQTGAVGSTSYKEPEVDESSMSAAEFAKKYNIPRI